MNRDRGYGMCTHTNDNFYGRNGCHACDRELAEWRRKEQEANRERELQDLRRRVAELEKKGKA